MNSAGWYPDPSGQPGMYRYWTGTQWTPALSPDPNTPPPYGMLPPASADGATSAASRTSPPARRAGVGWWIGLTVLAVVVATVAWYGVGFLGSWLGGARTGQIGNNPAAGACPTPTAAQATPSAVSTADGRVHGGKLSYPLLTSGWWAPETEDRLPFGTHAVGQIFPVEENYDGKGSSWVASIVVADLVSATGWTTPQQASNQVAQCIIGTFYGDAAVQRADQVSKAVQVDGRDAWLLETHLGFTISGLQTKGETAIILIVSTGTNAASIYYASIPDTSPALIQPARDAMAALRVSS